MILIYLLPTLPTYIKFKFSGGGRQTPKVLKTLDFQALEGPKALKGLDLRNLGGGRGARHLWSPSYLGAVLGYDRSFFERTPLSQVLLFLWKILIIELMLQGLHNQKKYLYIQFLIDKNGIMDNTLEKHNTFALSKFLWMVIDYNC